MQWTLSWTAFPDCLKLSHSQSSAITASINAQYLTDAFSRSIRKSAPGMDSLPYETVCLIIDHPPIMYKYRSTGV